LNILFKIKQSILIAMFAVVIVFLFVFLYFQIIPERSFTKIDYEYGVDIVNPKFIKDKKNKDQLKVTANKAIFLSDRKILLDGEVKYASNNFTLESNKVNFDKINFDANSEENTLFISEKVSIKSEGFNVENKGNDILFIGKSKLEIK
tara:strand:+ start:1459 stop:1902 length:444 start_codon:yes stop_codon:yes gene_type:complete